MMTLLLPAILSLALQSAAPALPPVVPLDLSQLPLEEAAAPRCGVVFAIVEGWQQAGDKRAGQWPDLASGNGREFFVRAMARLMDDRGLDRDAISALVSREYENLSGDNGKRVNDLMSPCLLMKQAAGL